MVDEAVRQEDFKGEIMFVRASIMLTISFLITVGNLILIKTLRRSNKMRRTRKILLISLSTADLFVGCVIIPIQLSESFYAPWRSTIPWCQFSFALDYFNMWTSFTSLVLFLLDLITHTQSPIQYARICTPKRSVFAVFSLWFWFGLISIVLAFSGLTITHGVENLDFRFCNALMFKEGYLTALCYIDILILIAFGLFYKKLNHVARQQIKNTASLRILSILQRERLRQQKINKTNMARRLIVVFCACWCPSILRDVLNAYDAEIVTQSFIMVAAVAVYSKSFFYCVIYYNSHGGYKRYFRRFLNLNVESTKKKSRELRDRALSKIRLGLRTPHPRLLDNQEEENADENNNNQVVSHTQSSVGNHTEIVARTQTSV